MGDESVEWCDRVDLDSLRSMETFQRELERVYWNRDEVESFKTGGGGWHGMLDIGCCELQKGRGLIRRVACAHDIR